MGREIYIYTLNSQKAKEHLSKKLAASPESIYSFFNAFDDYYKGRTRKKAFLELIQKIATDITTISVSELWLIINWIYEDCLLQNSGMSKYVLEAHHQKQLHHYGIHLLYESYTKSIAYGFMFLLGSYGDYADINWRHDEDGQIISHQNFMEFLDYMSYIMILIAKDAKTLTEEDKLFWKMLYQEEDLQEQYRNSTNFLNIIQKEFEFIRKMKVNDMQALDRNQYIETNTYYSWEHFYHTAMDLKKHLEGGASPAFILDSM